MFNFQFSGLDGLRHSKLNAKPGKKSPEPKTAKKNRPGPSTKAAGKARAVVGVEDDIEEDDYLDDEDDSTE